LEAAGRVTIKVETDLMEIGEAETPAMGIVEELGKVATGLKVVIKAEIEQEAVIREVTEPEVVTREETDPEVDIKVVPALAVSGQVVVIKAATGKVVDIKVDTGKEEEDTPVGVGQAVPGKEVTDQMEIVLAEATREVIVRVAINKVADIRGEITTIGTDILQEVPAMINQEVMVKTGAITKVI
jgi:hypothetical protein